MGGVSHGTDGGGYGDGAGMMAVPTSMTPMTALSPATATLGVMGGGQLGRMFVQAAQRLGFSTVVLDADPASPAGLIAHQHIQTDYLDSTGLAQLAACCDAVTTEFENVPAQALRLLAEHTGVYPSAAAVAVCQDRALEKQYFQRSGVRCAPFVELNTLADCAAVAHSLFPAILKTAQMGYDGKGQASVACAADLPDAFNHLGGVRCVLEQKLPLAYEVSVIVARGADGETVHLPVQQNVHRNGILHTTQVPASAVPVATAAAAIAAAQQIALEIAYVGVLCVEFFILQDGSLVANEIAPRPHNSGHYSMDACDLSQYDLQVRTLARLPLVQPVLMQPAVMLNVLGDVWFKNGVQREPNFAAVLAIPGAQLHLYGKRQPKIGRKMGHITVLGNTLAAANAGVAACAAVLGIAA